MDYRTATKVLSAVEQATLEQMVKENPGNTYWEKRLADFIDNMNPADVAQIAEREIDAMLDPRTPEQIALDEWQAEASDVGYGKNGRPQ